jgi:hypothetical protein
VSSDVFPAPLVPRRRNVGVVALLSDARYRNEWTSIGRENAKMKAMRIARGSPDNSRESRLSGADQAILPD